MGVAALGVREPRHRGSARSGSFPLHPDYLDQAGVQEHRGDPAWQRHHAPDPTWEDVLSSADRGLALPGYLRRHRQPHPHVDALGVIAVGVEAGMESRNVMLGRASWMRLPSIVGVELSGKPQPGITATDLVLSLTEFLRQQKVVGAWSFVAGAPPPSPSAIGPPSQHGARVWRYPRPCSSSTSRPSTTSKLTGRDDEQVRLVETYARGPVSGPMPWQRPVRAGAALTCRAWVARLAEPSNPHRRLPVSALAERGIAVDLDRLVPRADGLARWRRHHRRHHQLHQHQQPRNVIAAGPLARNASLPARSGAQAPGSNPPLAPGSKTVALCRKEAGLDENQAAPASASWRLPAPPANGMSGALDPAIQQEIIGAGTSTPRRCCRQP